MSHPLFSVLIANFNNGRFLMEAINSVRGQTYANWEIILVDDASTDSSPVLYKQLAQDARIHIYYNEGNRGCGYTKRRCAELANGEICGFLDPDDALVNNALEVMVKEHINRSDISMIYSRYYLVDRQMNVIGTSTHQCKLPDNITFLEYGEGAISHFVSFKKSYYDITPGINPFYKRAVDHALYFLMEEVGRVRFIDKPLYYYRANTGQNISTYSQSDAAFLWDLIIMSDACRRRGLSIEDIVLVKFKSFIGEIKDESYLNGMDAVRQTRTYKTGKFVTKPLRYLKELFKERQ